jgi:hypothetical protein
MGISPCEKGTCSGSVALGSTVTVTASADTGFFFAGWDGACSGHVTLVALVLGHGVL